jgi:hypothetical protein
MPRFAHPVHTMTDVEQARVRGLFLEWLLRYDDEPTALQQEHRFLLFLKAGAAPPGARTSPCCRAGARRTLHEHHSARHP